MIIATLLAKAYGSFSTRAFESLLIALCKDLEVRIRVLGIKGRDWIQAEVTGEDEVAAINLLDREIGLAPVSGEKIHKFALLQGRVVNSAKSKTELHVDIGVFEPHIRDAAIPLGRLQAQLSDGNSIPFQRLIDLFGLRDYAPLCIKVLDDLDSERDVWEAELSEWQLAKYSVWLYSNTDRLIVLGANRGEVEVAVERARHWRDIIGIETLGPLEHAIVCKLGTDAVGLVPKVGPYLGAATLAPLSPRKIRQLVTRRS